MTNGDKKNGTSNILVVGANGFIGQMVLKKFPEFKALHHKSPFPAQIPDCLIFCGKDPLIGSPDFRCVNCHEARWAAYARSQSCRFIHLGTRAVYSPKGPANSPHPHHEDDETKPQSIYGRNKLDLEHHLLDHGPEDLLICRTANVFGDEFGRRSFTGMMSSSLLEHNRIFLDISADVKRDFIAVEECATILAALATSRIKGIINLGSGRATALNDIARAMIEGYGKGEAIIKNDCLFDGFVLDIQRLKQHLPSLTQSQDVNRRFRQIGANLKKLDISRTQR